MSIRFPRRLLLAAALLSLGVTPGANAVDTDDRRVTASPEVVTSQKIGIGVSLPSQALTASLLASRERDVRGGRIATQLDSHRHVLAMPRVPTANRRILGTRDDVGRLLRAGLHSSSLGTPPPLS